MRTIDAKEMERQAKEAFKANPVCMGVLLQWIRRQPTIDAVPVVRCKDCKHLMFSDCYGECGAGHWGIVQPNHFCSYGKRKDGDG